MMKRFFLLFLMITLVMSMIGCTASDNGGTTSTEQPIHSSSPYTSLVAWANWSENSEIIAKSLNYEKMSISSVRHLPIFKCSSLNDLNDFKSRFKDILSLSTGYDEVLSFEKATEGFKTDFFKENTLFLVYVTAGSGSFRFALDSYSVNDGTFCANIIQTNHPEVFTEDMAGWLIIIPVSNDQLSNIKNYDSVMKYEIRD